MHEVYTIRMLKKRHGEEYSGEVRGGAQVFFLPRASEQSEDPPLSSFLLQGLLGYNPHENYYIRYLTIEVSGTH